MGLFDELMKAFLPESKVPNPKKSAVEIWDNLADEAKKTIETSLLICVNTRGTILLPRFYWDMQPVFDHYNISFSRDTLRDILDFYVENKRDADPAKSWLRKGEGNPDTLLSYYFSVDGIEEYQSRIRDNKKWQSNDSDQWSKEYGDLTYLKGFERDLQEAIKNYNPPADEPGWGGIY